jgi:hypothetical protein
MFTVIKTNTVWSLIRGLKHLNELGGQPCKSIWSRGIISSPDKGWRQERTRESALDLRSQPPHETDTVHNAHDGFPRSSVKRALDKYKADDKIRIQVRKMSTVDIDNVSKVTNYNYTYA